MSVEGTDWVGTYLVKFNSAWLFLLTGVLGEFLDQTIKSFGSFSCECDLIKGATWRRHDLTFPMMVIFHYGSQVSPGVIYVNE